MKYLTKSRFKQAVECPKKLFYTSNKQYKNIKNENSFLRSLADGGFQVGELAKLLYPDGIEIEDKDVDRSLQATAFHLKKEKVVLFEPAIAFQNLLVRVDVLVKNGNSLELIEVKAKSIDSTDIAFQTKKGIRSGIKSYIEDVAFQTHVLRNAFPTASITSYLLMPDKSKVAKIDQMNQFFKITRVNGVPKITPNNLPDQISLDESLLHHLNVDDLIQIVMEQGIEYPGGSGLLPEIAREWSISYAQNLPITAPIGVHCSDCEFKAPLGGEEKSGFHECWKHANNWTDDDFQKPLSLDLWNFRGKKNFFTESPPKLYLSSITQDDIKYSPSNEGLSDSERQWMQINGLPEENKKMGFFIDAGFMQREVDSWNYPYHFIDFETSAVALPFHHGMKPYESVAFQFSHHILENDGKVKHANQFLLAEPGVFPNYEFARALKKSLENDKGSVFMWANHENTILSHICHQLRTRNDAPADRDEIITFLETLIKGGSRAMVDLKKLAQKAYFHPAYKGSNSIKKVLPAVLSNSQYLRKIYSRPIYGAEGGIPSKNFKDMIWWAEDSNNKVIDPYTCLVNQKSIAPSNLVNAEDELEVNEGGAASTAYGRLQYENLDLISRKDLKEKLLKYCELDTLAMVMIVQAWLSYLSDDFSKSNLI